MRVITNIFDGTMTVHVQLSRRNVDALLYQLDHADELDRERPGLMRGDGSITLFVEAQEDDAHYHEPLRVPGAMTWELDAYTDDEADDEHANA